jgi:two-component system, LytTR family, response regulator
MIAYPEALNIIIVDDEKEACANLKNILIEYIDPLINIAGIANSSLEAEKLISHRHPDAIFLDVEMPGEDAFHFLERIVPFTFEIVFVTAYDEYAVKAFKLNAIDYILKPISFNELANAVKKLKEKIYYKKYINEVSPSYTELSKQVSNKTKQHRITLKDNNNIEIVEFRNIYFIEAKGSYSRVLFSKNGILKDITMSTSIAEYEELLPAEMFYRIHKSYLINCLHVRQILKDESNHIVINNEFTLPVSRRRYTPLLEFLKSNKYNYE